MSSFPFSQGPLDTEHPWACLCQVDMFQTVPDTSSYVKVRHHRLLDQVMFEGQFGVLSLKTAHSEMILNVKTFSKPLSLFVFKTSVSTPACCQNGLFYADFMRLLKFLNATYFLYYFLSLTPVAWVPNGGHFIFLRVEKAYMFTLSSQCWSVDLWSVWFTKLDSTFFPSLLQKCCYYGS